jgi:hypothetical protein
MLLFLIEPITRSRFSVDRMTSSAQRIRRFAVFPLIEFLLGQEGAAQALMRLWLYEGI